MRTWYYKENSKREVSYGISQKISKKLNSMTQYVWYRDACVRTNEIIPSPLKMIIFIVQSVKTQTKSY